MGIFPDFGAFVLRAEEKDGRTCINGLPVASPSKQMLGRFPRLQDIKHDHLCEYLHFSETIIARDLVIIVTEYHTSSLADQLQDGPLEELDKIRYIQQIVSAMDFLHRRHFSHGALSLDVVRYAGNGIVKLCQHGLSYLTKKGKDSASTINGSVYMAPERIIQRGGIFATASYNSDVWDLGIVLAQLYLGVKFDDILTEEDYYVILNKNERNNAEQSEVFTDICSTISSNMPEYTQLPWLEELITSCLQLDCEKRILMCEVHQIVRTNTSNEDVNGNKYKVKTIKEIEEEIDKESADGMIGFENLTLENSFHLWKTCGSTPEMILLKNGFIQNHSPISSYPGIRCDDFLQMDAEIDNQSTFTLGTLQLPNKRTMERVEIGHTVSATPLHTFGMLEEKKYENSLYETSSNILTVEHFINTATYSTSFPRSLPLSEFIPRIAEMGIFPTQRAKVWRVLLNINVSKWREYLDLDLLAPHSSDRQLEVDIPRCHQYDSFMTTPAVQESLRKVLKGWQIMTENDNYVYWQGCDSLATPFLLANINQPHVAYACFKEFTNRYCHKFYLKDNSEVIKEYLGVFYLLVAYVDPVLYKHLKINGFDAELFAIPWFLTCFAHELPLSKLVLLWDETMMHDNAFPLMIALAMLNRLRDKLLAVNFNEMIIIIHDQPDLSIEDVIKNARGYEEVVPPSCTFRAHASPWKAKFAPKLNRIPNSMQGLSLAELSGMHCPRLSPEELIWRLKHKMVYAIDTRPEPEFQSNHFIGAHNHPKIDEADIDWLRFLPGIVASQHPKCFIYRRNDKDAAFKLAEQYVMKGVPYVCVLSEPFESIEKMKNSAESTNSFIASCISGIFQSDHI